MPHRSLQSMPGINGCFVGKGENFSVNRFEDHFLVGSWKVGVPMATRENRIPAEEDLPREKANATGTVPRGMENRQGFCAENKNLAIFQKKVRGPLQGLCIRPMDAHRGVRLSPNILQSPSMVPVAVGDEDIANS